MAYNEKPQIKLYAYRNNSFELQAIIDDYMECSFERNLYQAGTFTISINYNIPNAQLFQRGLFVQFGDDPYDFGEITRVTDAIGGDGKASQIRTVTGYDARYILKRRVIKNMNANGTWQMTGKGETCLRNLVKDQCGAGAEEKRRLPISNTIPATENAIGKTYSVSESFSNLYEVCKTIATQSEIGWRMAFDGYSLTLECYEGTDRSGTVQFSTSFDSLADGNFTDSAESFSNAIYVGGKGQNDDRDIYEGETGSPAGLDRFECWDNQSSMTTEDEYAAEAFSMLTQYGQTIDVSGNGLAKSPYVYKKQYDVGDSITLAFSGKSAVVQILSVTERWAFGAYTINFSFGKPQNSLSDQLQLMLRKIQEASNKTSSTDSVRWYTIPTDTAMPKEDVTYSTIGFLGTVSTGATFTLYLDDENTGSKTYHVYFKQLAGTGKLTLTTGKAGAADLVMNAGTYVAIIYVDGNGNVTSQGATATDTIESGNTQPATSNGVNSAISGAVSDAIDALDVASVGGSGKYISAISETDGKISATASDLATSVASGSSAPVTSEAVYDLRYKNTLKKNLSVAKWYKIATIESNASGCAILLQLGTTYYNQQGCSHTIQVNYGYKDFNIVDTCKDSARVFSKIKICQPSGGGNYGLYVYYNKSSENPGYFSLVSNSNGITLHNFIEDEIVWATETEYNLGTNGIYVNGQSYNTTNTVTSGSVSPVTSGGVENYVGKSYSVSGSVHPTIENQHFEICRLTVPAGKYVVIGYSEFNVSVNNVYNLRLLYAAGSVDRIVRGNATNGGGIINSYIVQSSEAMTIIVYGYGYPAYVNNENAKQSATLQAIKIGD